VRGGSGGLTDLWSISYIRLRLQGIDESGIRSTCTTVPELRTQIETVVAERCSCELMLAGGPGDLRLQQRVAALELQCAEYRVLDETADAIPFRLEPDLQRFTYIGPQAERLLGIEQSTWVEPGFFEARLSQEDRTATIEQCRLVVEFACEHEAEFRFRRDDGSWVWLRCAMRLFESSTGPTLAGHFFDVTMRRMLATDHAQSQKLEAIGRLASGVAHEINTPIQFISDNITFVQDGIRDLLNVLGEYRHAACSLAAAEIERLAELERSSDLAFLAENMPVALVRTVEGLARVATLVRSMKEFAHPDSQEKANADLNSALQSTIVISTNEYRGVADVETDFGALPAVVCYVSELNQVFLNIIINAAHAISDVVGSTGARGTIRIATRTDGCDVVIAISDTGGGIPAHVGNRVFEPFFTTKDVGRGSGQGLSVARATVEKHGGSLTFESTAGAGTTFLVRLPIAGP
jgi:signal transduction histidine kinase